MKKYIEYYLNKKNIMYPAEYVIRIFKGKYPSLNLSKEIFSGKKILDLSCGDGRHLIFLSTLGFKLFGTEISESIVRIVKEKLKKLNITADIRVGTNDHIPFEDNYFDFLLSWNVCYYMREENLNFLSHVKEYSRVLKPSGKLILSIPKKTNFIYQDSEEILPGYRKIKDYFGVRDGIILKCFENLQEIIKWFSPYFTNFKIADIHDNCFGLNYHWYIIVCEKR